MTHNDNRFSRNSRAINRTKNNKKAQMQILNQILVIIVFSFILLLALIVYFLYQKHDVSTKLEYLEEEDAVNIAEIVVHMAELSSPTFIEKSGSFLDITKLKIFANLSQTQIGRDVEFIRTYGSMLKYSNITLYILYPNSSVINIYDYPPDNYAGTIPIYYPIVAYDPTTKTNYFSILEVKKYVHYE